MGSLGITKLGHQDTSSLAKQQQQHMSAEGERYSRSSQTLPEWHKAAEAQNSAKAARAVLWSVSLCRDHRRMQTVTMERHRDTESIVSVSVGFNLTFSKSTGECFPAHKNHIPENAFSRPTWLAPLLGAVFQRGKAFPQPTLGTKTKTKTQQQKHIHMTHLSFQRHQKLPLQSTFKKLFLCEWA